jgi:serine protease
MTMKPSWRLTLIVVLCLLTVACGGRRAYTVSAEAGEGGSASPVSQRVTQGNTAQVTFTADPGYLLDEVESDCGGSLAGNVYTTGRVFTDCTVSATFTLEGASLSGIITPAAAITVDGTVNDRFAAFVDNSSFSTAQYLNNLVTVHGFASTEPTGGNGLFERFHDTPDPHDFYRVFLQAGQIIQLQIVDFEGLNLQGEFQGDLDLYLYNHDQDFVDADISTSALAQPSSMSRTTRSRR